MLALPIGYWANKRGIMFILHNYPESPYAEKIRLMLGFTGLGWSSVDVPPVPPRPSLDPALGGYRRIPVMQDGADYYCDSALIADQIAERTATPRLSPFQNDPDIEAFLAHAEGDIFIAGIMSAPKLKMLVSGLSKRGLGLFKLVADRASAARQGGMGGFSAAEGKQMWADHIADLATRLSASPFLGGEQPDIRDFAAYHTIWINSISAGGTFPPSASAVVAWRDRMTGFGHGAPDPLSGNAALDIAANTDPAPLAEGVRVEPRAAAIAPADYMRDETRGDLVGETAQSWILARHTDRLGTVHVHFPKAGYTLV